jgi:hypothetical protein
MPLRPEVKDTPSSVTEIAAAMAALGLYGGANTPAERVAEARRLGGDNAYRVQLANAVLGAARDVRLDPGALLGESWRPDLLGGVMTVQASGDAADVTNWAASTFRPLQPGAGSAPQRLQLTARPYFAWANRQPGPMRVWIPLRQSASK